MLDRDHFTLIFKGDIGRFKQSPMVTDTPYGRPIAAGRGNSFDEADVLIDALERIEAICQQRGSYEANQFRSEILQIAQAALLGLK
jgi:hypothetical protein